MTTMQGKVQACSFDMARIEQYKMKDLCIPELKIISLFVAVVSLNFLFWTKMPFFLFWEIQDNFFCNAKFE